MYDFWQDQIPCELRSLARAEGWDQLSPMDELLRGGAVEQQAVEALPRLAAQARGWRMTLRWLLAGRWGRPQAALGETAATGGGTLG
jgi:hypothetical protein